MISYRTLFAALLGAACLPTTLAAQAMIQPLGQTDADLLAAQMRLLASDPRNMAALATAGELSLRLGDLSGAAALFARADKVDPRSGRVKAGMGSILVRSERPGEALRFFSQAESYGWPVANYAADRGLAFDLIGQQDRAQRDYRLALQNGPSDETARRYALSLGISGKQAQALEQLDPLVRRQDRAAWRARAFVMAMNGDTAGAAKIATTMMPAGMAQGLGAFFQRLPTLPAIDRAFAVHFGEITTTPARLADARLAPAYAPLPPEVVAAPPVQVAAVVVDPRQDRRSRRDRERAERDSRRAAAARPAARAVAIAAAVPVTSPTSAAAMRESNVRVAAVATPTQPPLATTLPTRPAPTAIASVAPTLPSSLPASAPRVATVTTVPSYRAPTVAALMPVTASPASGTTFAAAIPPVSRPITVASTPVAPPGNVPAGPSAATTTPAATTAPTPGFTTPAPVVAQVAPPVAVASAAVAPTTAASTPVASTPVAPVPSQAATERADSVLARIVASLSIPASELGVVEPGRPDPSPVPIPAAVERVAPSTTGRRVVAEASAKEGRDAALRRTVAARLTGDAEADEPAATRSARGRRGATTLAAADPVTTRGARGRRGAPVEAASVPEEETPPTGRRTRGRRGAPVEAASAAEDETPATARRTRGRRGAADPVELAAADTTTPKTRSRRGAAAEEEAPLTPVQRRAAARKDAADKKAAADKKELADKAAAEKKAARGHPARIWVQVAGGANEGDLGKAWSAAQAKAPALKARAGYKTPLRATNRVLTGPFKTDAEARAFVNQLGKQGVSAFSFTSDAGQKVEKLGGK